MSVEPTAVPTHYTHPGATLIILAPCPTCDAEVPWHCDPRQPWPEPRCPKPTCNTTCVIER